MKSVTLCTTHEIRNSYFKLSLNKTQNCYTDRSLKHSRKKNTYKYIDQDH